jgi:hypothetical protein
MNRRLCMGVLALTFGAGIAGAVSGARSQVIDMSKYPNISGGWGRSEVYQWARGEQPPLTPEYQKVYEATLADRKVGGSGTDTMYRCFPPGMPRVMHMYSPMEIVITPKTTYMLIDHIHDDRRIFTDGRGWPGADFDPQFNGYSIGKWVDDDGDGKYDALEVETRFIKGPHSLDGVWPSHADGQMVVKERIYLDKDNANILHDQITVMDHAYTRPLTVTKNYPRYSEPGATGWPEEVCAEAQVWVNVGKENYFLSSDGYLMPTKKDQAPPDLRYFNQAQKK